MPPPPFFFPFIIFCSIIPSLFEMPHFLAGVWMCIHSGRMGAYYTLSEAVTAAFSEEAKHFTAQTMYPGGRAHTHTHTHMRIQVCTHRTVYTRTHWHNAHRRDERANLSNHQPRQAWGRIVPALVCRKRAGCASESVCVCVCVCGTLCDFSFFFFFPALTVKSFLPP